MAEETGLRPPLPVGGGGGQDGGGAYVKLRRGGADDDGGGGGGPPRERAPRSDGPEIKLAPGLRDELPEAALLAFDRLNARLGPLQKERDALRAQAAQLRQAAEAAGGAGGAGEYGVTAALESVIKNRRSLSGTPGFMTVAVKGLGAVAHERGAEVWRRAAAHVTETVRAASHAADTVGLLGGGVFAVVTLLGDRQALARRGRDIAARLAAAPFKDGARIWALEASFGGVEIGEGGSAAQIIAAAEQARTGGGAPADEKQSAPAEPPGPPPPPALSDEDLARLAVTGAVAPPLALTPAPAEAEAKKKTETERGSGSGDDVRQ